MATVTTRCGACGALSRANAATCWLCGKSFGPPPAVLVSQRTVQNAGHGLEVYSNALRVVFRDEQVDEDEARNLHALADKYQLAPAKTLPLRVRAFEEHLQRALSDSYLSDSEVQLLRDNLVRLGLTAADIPAAGALIQQTLYLQSIRAGKIPVLPAEQVRVALKSGEQVHLQVDAVAVRKKTVTTGYAGGFTGASFRIAKGVRWHVGGTRGRPIREEQLVNESEGLLVISNQRISYMATAKAFSFPWKKVMGADPFVDGIILYIEGRATSPTLLYKDKKQAEAVAAICDYYVGSS